MNKRFCKEPEKIENYEKAKADNFKGWNCHHRKGVDIPREELKALGMYYNRPADELIFLKIGEHISLHQSSVESKKKNSESHKGQTPWNKGKKLSEETREKLREVKKGLHWFNNGKISKRAKECPPGFVPGRIEKLSEEAKEKIGEAKKGNTYTKGMHWYNNGKINIVAKECPEGFVPGRLR